MLKWLARRILKRDLSTLRNTLQALESKNFGLEAELTASRNALANEIKNRPFRIRLSRDTMTHLKSTLPMIAVVTSTTDLQAASMVGMQMVIDKLEKEFVDDRA